MKTYSSWRPTFRFTKSSFNNKKQQQNKTTTKKSKKTYFFVFSYLGHVWLLLSSKPPDLNSPNPDYFTSERPKSLKNTICDLWNPIKGDFIWYFSHLNGNNMGPFLKPLDLGYTQCVDRDRRRVSYIWKWQICIHSWLGHY